MNPNTITVSVTYNFDWLPDTENKAVDVLVGSASVGAVTCAGYGTPGLPAEVAIAARKWAGWPALTV